jgi:sarcosine oxidase
MSGYDAIVIGTGGVGSAAVFHLARRGLRVLGLDRFEAGHDRGSSHGQTRIIRKAYFEHPDYVPLLHRAYELWRELEERRGESLVFPVGLVQVGSADGAVVRGVLESAKRHRLGVETLSAADFARRFPAFRPAPEHIGVYEAEAGYLRVEACVCAHLAEAVACGAELMSGVAVAGWRAVGGGVEVETDRGTFQAERLVIAAGPWAASLLGELGCMLEVRRKPQYWFAAETNIMRVEQGCPCFLFELPAGVFYGFPQIDERGVKVAQHTGGRVVADPMTVDRSIDESELAEARRFVRERLVGVMERLASTSVCMYTMSPDEHFIVDRHPEHAQVVLAAGLSGHGFKFTSVLGEVLADLAIDGSTKLPIGFLSVTRPALRGAKR